MAETVARVGKSTVGSLMMKVTSGIPWSGQKPKESREVGQNEEESIQPKSLFPDHEVWYREQAFINTYTNDDVK